MLAEWRSAACGRRAKPLYRIAHPPHCFTQEVGGTASGVGPALAQPAHQHIASGGQPAASDSPAFGIAVVANRPFLGQSVGLADGGIHGVPPGPAPAAQARASNSRLTRSNGWPHRKLAEVPDGALTVEPRVQAVPPAQRIGVVDASPPASADTGPPRWPAPARGPGRGKVRAGPGAGRGWPEGADRHWPPVGGRRR